jgi:hypothetical protein
MVRSNKSYNIYEKAYWFVICNGDYYYNVLVYMKREMHGYLDMQIQVWSIVKVSSEYALLMHRATPIPAQQMSQWLVSIA